MKFPATQLFLRKAPGKKAYSGPWSCSLFCRGARKLWIGRKTLLLIPALGGEFAQGIMFSDQPARIIPTLKKHRSLF